ncbi:MAG: ribonuclease Y [Planctomycetota bacterium]|nr:MAG: ribonuclease Y [Planctomycetota bacterium]
MEEYVVLISVLSFLFGLVAAFLYFNLTAQNVLKRSKETAESILQEAKREAEAKLQDAQQQAREEFTRRREEFEAEIGEKKKELRIHEKRLSKREDNLDKKLDVVTKKERFLENKEQKLQNWENKLQQLEEKKQQLIDEQNKLLQKISGLSREEGIKLYLSRLEKEVEHEAATMIANIVENAKEEANAKVRRILATAIQRVAVEHTRETVVSTVELPNEEMKGRIIGREGRNIRAFEQVTGVDVIVDDTPGIVVISCFDSVRREIARRALEKLILDGRIHPARIEEIVENTKKEVNYIIMEAGKQAVYDLNLSNMHSKMIQLVGRLKFRTSYGQNVLQHSIECAHLCGAIAGELGLDVTLAKRCGLLHDIGKAVDHDMEGGHPEIGAILGKRYDERPEVINSIASHHEDVPQETIYAVITQVADAISGSRPGARGESLERYIKRLEKLESIATSIPGVRQAYAIQAGREIRVIVNSEKINDKHAAKICRDIAKTIEQELTYPGEVKVTVVREVRVTEYAR